MEPSNETKFIANLFYYQIPCIFHGLDIGVICQLNVCNMKNFSKAINQILEAKNGNLF